MRRWLKHIGIALALLLVLLAGGLVGARYWLASEGGRDLISGLAADAGVRLEGIAGDPFGRLEVARVEVTDAEGAWLTVEDAVLDWRFGLDLLRRRIVVDAVTARRLAVLREPVAEPSPAPDESSGPFEPPALTLDLKRLAVDEIEIAETLAGTPARLRLEASAGYARQAAELHVEIDRLDGPGEVTLIATFGLEANAFDIDLTLRDPAGGLATALLDLPDGAEARLEGGGDLNGWKGKLLAKTGGHVLADLAIDVARTDPTVRLGINGDLAPGPLLPPDIAPLVGERARIDLAAAANVAGGPVVLDRLTLATAAADLDATGRFEPQSGALSAEVRTTRVDPAAIARFAPDVAVDTPTLRAEAGGTVEAPTARAWIDAAAVRAGGVALSAIEVAIDAAPATDAPDSFRWTARADIGAIDLGDPALNETVVGAWQATAGGVFNPASDEIPLQVEAGGAQGASARFDGRVAPDVSGDVEASLANLAILRPLAGLPLSGPGEATAGLVLDDAGLKLAGLSVTALGLTVAGDAALDGDFAEIDAALTTRAGDLGPLARVLDAPLAGALAGEIKLTGPVADPSAAGTVRLAPLVLAGERFPSARLRFDAKTLASGPAGSADLEAATPYGQAKAATGFALTEERLRLDRVRVEAPGARATGAAALNLASLQGTGDIALDIRSLAEALRPFGMDAAGSGAGRIRLQGANVTAELDLAGVAAAGIKAKTVALDAKAGLAPTAPLDVTLAIADLDAGDALAEDARLTLKGPLTDASVRLTARGEAADEPLEADLEGRLAVTDAGQRFRLTAGKGAVAGAPFTLASGLEVRINAGGFAVTSLALASKPLTLEADAALGDRGVDLDLRKAEADLGALADLVPGMPVTGVATASGRIQGPLSAPSGRIDMVGRDLHAAEAPDGTVVQIEGALTLAPDRLGVDISATGLGETPLTVKGGVGLAGGGDGPPAPTLASPLDIRVAWTGDIEPLVLLAPLDEHRLTGAADVDLTLGGTLGEPVADGAVTLGPGGYEHLDYGTKLAYERIRVQAAGRTLTLEPFTARAGEGTLAGEGRIELDPTRGLPMRLDVMLNQARLAARDDVRAVASGDVRIESGREGISVYARIRTDQVEVELIDTGAASVATLDVIEVGPLPEGREPEEPEGPAGPPIALDVGVEIPERFYVRGRGLESEWAGNVAVTGTAAQPEVNGQLALKRGAFDIVGKRLDLTEGTVRLEPDASDRLEAIVDVLAEYEGADFAAAIRVAGPATDPKLTLSSTPDLPRDEILARLLFNKNAGALTATESLQLAAAAASLVTGGGGGFDPVAEIRRAVGIDALRVDVDGEGEPTVEAGKYLTDDVYVGVKQGAGPEAGAVTVEVEVFDNITLDSEARQDGSQKVGARLKWDY